MEPRPNSQDSQSSARLELVQSIAESMAAFPQVEAVALSGSVASGSPDPGSDIDVYVYVTREIPVSARAQLIGSRASYAEIDNRFFETGDEWVDATSGIAVDMMYRDPNWIEGELDRLLRRHEASVGYSTALWHNVRYAIPLFDRSGWFARLQGLAGQEYPEELRSAVVAKNHPILRDNVSSYTHQLEKAARRGDLVSANHRVAALLASYFDILFAVNRRTNPGEKRLLAYAAGCERVPARMVEQVEALLQAACSPDGDRDGRLTRRAEELVDGLDELLIAEGLLPPE